MLTRPGRGTTVSVLFPAADAKILALKPDAPIILSSGYDEAELAQRFSERGIAAFIQKPYQVDRLRTVLQSVPGPNNHPKDTEE